MEPRRRLTDQQKEKEQTKERKEKQESRGNKIMIGNQAILKPWTPGELIKIVDNAPIIYTVDKTSSVLGMALHPMYYL